MDISALSQVLAGQPEYRFRQVNQAVFQDLISDWNEASSLPKSLRDQLASACPLVIRAEVVSDPSSRSSVKALITLADRAEVETVLIRQKGNQEEGRHTVCVSSQVGCPLGCKFCATGTMGFNRNLQAEEIVEQVVYWARYLKAEAPEKKIDNVVFMGMGEPFLNYREFLKALKFLNNPETLNIGARRISVSTSGVIDGIKRLAGEKLQINLAISLHAPNDAKRRELMPIADMVSLKELFRAVDAYIAKTGRRVMFEYLLLKGVNDGDDQAAELAVIMKKPLYLVNLIPYNQTEVRTRFQAPSRERVDAFKAVLERAGVPVTVRKSYGSSIGGACGQLRGRRPGKETAGLNG